MNILVLASPWCKPGCLGRVLGLGGTKVPTRGCVAMGRCWPPVPPLEGPTCGVTFQGLMLRRELEELKSQSLLMGWRVSPAPLPPTPPPFLPRPFPCHPPLFGLRHIRSTLHSRAFALSSMPCLHLALHEVLPSERAWAACAVGPLHPMNLSCRGYKHHCHQWVQVCGQRSWHVVSRMSS